MMLQSLSEGRMRSQTRLLLPTAGLVLLGAACESGVGGGGDGGLEPAKSLEFLVLTEEIEVDQSQIAGGASFTRYLMSVGSLGTALAFGNGPATVTIGNPSVLVLTHSDPGSVEFRAAATGRSQILASGNGLSKSVTVEVLESPQPIDKLQVVSAGAFPPRIESSDPQGNLAEATVSLPNSFALMFYVYRSGHELSAIPFTLQPAEPGILEVTTHCRPVDIDSHCDVYSQWGWITGRTLGTTVVTVAVRNKQLPILVHVAQP